MVDPYQNVIAYLQLPEVPASPLYVSNQQEKWKLRKSKIKALLVLDTKIFILWQKNLVCFGFQTHVLTPF